MGLDVEAAEGFADSGEFDEDLTDLLVALGEAAREHGSGVVFLIDEVHFLTTPELEALIAACVSVGRNVSERDKRLRTRARIERLP